MELADGHERVPTDCQALVGRRASRRRRWWYSPLIGMGEILLIRPAIDHSRSRVNISKSGRRSSLWDLSKQPLEARTTAYCIL